MGSDCCKNTGHTNYMSIQTDQLLKSDLSQSYQQAQNLITKFHRLRKSVIKCRGKVQSLTNLPLNHPLGLLQNLQVLLWALSAVCKGKSLQSNFTITKEPPYLQINSKSLPQETQELLNYLQTYLEVVITGCRSINKILEGFSILNTELKRWKYINSANNEVKNMIELDYQRLVYEMKETEVFANDLHKINSKVGVIILKIKDLIQASDEIGYQASIDGLINPKDIATRFQDFLYQGKRGGKSQGRHTEDSLQITFENSPERNKSMSKKGFFDFGDAQFNTQETVNSALLLTTRETNIDYNKENINRELAYLQLQKGSSKRLVKSTTLEQKSIEENLNLGAKQRSFKDKTVKISFELPPSKKQIEEFIKDSNPSKAITSFGQTQEFISENIQDSEDSIKNTIQETPIKGRIIS